MMMNAKKAADVGGYGTEIADGGIGFEEVEDYTMNIEVLDRVTGKVHEDPFED